VDVLDHRWTVPHRPPHPTPVALSPAVARDRWDGRRPGRGPVEPS